MGMVVGSQSYIECDTPECLARSSPMFDQKDTLRIAEEAGWQKNYATGQTFCPKCLGRVWLGLNSDPEFMALDEEFIQFYQKVERFAQKHSMSTNKAFDFLTKRFR